MSLSLSHQHPVPLADQERAKGSSSDPKLQQLVVAISDGKISTLQTEKVVFGQPGAACFLEAIFGTRLHNDTIFGHGLPCSSREVVEASNVRRTKKEFGSKSHSVKIPAELKCPDVGECDV